MNLKAELLDEKAIGRTLKRISHEIIEKNKGTEDLVLIGVKRKGVPLANRIANFIENIEGNRIPVGDVDISLYRDDLNTFLGDGSIENMNLGVEVRNKKVILVDDVLYTGRTVRAAIDAIIAVGRPNSIQLAVLVDRGHRELPIRADYVGKNIQTSRHEMIKVSLVEIDDKDLVSIYE